MRSVPTPWRLATEYMVLRKLAPRSRSLNGFYWSGFAHDEAKAARKRHPAGAPEAVQDAEPVKKRARKSA